MCEQWLQTEGGQGSVQGGWAGGGLQDEVAASCRSLGGTAHDFAGDGIGDFDQLGASVNQWLDQGGKEGVVGTAQDNAVDTPVEQGLDAPGNVIGEVWVGKMQGFDTGSPAGTGSDMYVEMAGVGFDERLQTGAAGSGFGGENSDMAGA